MNIEVLATIGDSQYKFKFDEKDPKETLLLASIFGETPKYCHECSNNQYFGLGANKDKEGNIYVYITCKKCFAKANLGSYKTGGYFWKKFEKYEKQGSDLKKPDSTPEKEW